MLMKMDIRQAAAFLSLPVKTLERWIAQGFLPIPAGTSSSPIFDKSWLANWAKSKNLSISQTCQDDPACPAPAHNLVQAMRRGGVFKDVDGGTVDEALTQAASLSPVTSDHLQAFTQQLLERERLCSTGQGKGVAIPHVRSQTGDAGAEASITTCFLKEPLDFNAIDGKPVTTLFLLISPSVDVHLRLLSRLAFCLRDDSFVEFLNQRPTPEDLLGKVQELEAKVADSGL